MPSSANDRNMLFGILALQMDFIRLDALITAMNTWVLDKQKPLGQILLEQKSLTVEMHALLEALVHKHLEVHGNDVERSLAAVSSVGPVRQLLEQIADDDVQASLAHVPTTGLREGPAPQLRRGDHPPKGLRFASPPHRRAAWACHVARRELNRRPSKEIQVGRP